MHVYSPLWLALSALPITTDWTPAVGATLVGLFLLSLMLLPLGRGWAQVGIITLATLSGSVAFALERANNDLVIFILATVIIRLRWCGYGLAVFAAMLKFYPAVLLALAVRERLCIFIVIGVAAVVALAGFAAFYLDDLMRVLPSIPTTSYFDAYAFGARNLPFGLAETFGLSGGAAASLFGMLTLSHACLRDRGGLVQRPDTPHGRSHWTGSGVTDGRVRTGSRLLLHRAERVVSRHPFPVCPARPHRAGPSPWQAGWRVGASRSCWS